MTVLKMPGSLNKRGARKIEKREVEWAIPTILTILSISSTTQASDFISFILI